MICGEMREGVLGEGKAEKEGDLPAAWEPRVIRKTPTTGSDNKKAVMRRRGETSGSTRSKRGTRTFPPRNDNCPDKFSVRPTQETSNLGIF